MAASTLTHYLLVGYRDMSLHVPNPHGTKEGVCVLRVCVCVLGSASRARRGGRVPCHATVQHCQG